MNIVPKYQKGKRIYIGSTTTDHYGNKTYYLPVSKVDNTINVGLPEVTITPRNNLDLGTSVNKGRENFLNTAKELITPIATGAGIVGLGAGLVTSTIPTLASLGAGYLGGKVGKAIDNSNSNYEMLGQILGGAIGGIGTMAAPRLIARDTYSTVGGKFGYYGNPLQRVTGTLGRRFNFKTKAKYPELMRKLDAPIKTNSSGTLQVTNPNPRFSETITNFTTDRPVVSHSAGKWDMNDLYIFNPKITKGMKPASIEPSDTFYPNVNITAKPKQTTLVSGNVSRLISAKDKGMSTLSSPKARKLYQEAEHKYFGDLKTWKDKMKVVKSGADKRYLEGEEPMRSNYGTEYTKEIQRLQSKRGTPTVKDYKRLEDETGLDSGTIGIDEINPEAFSKIMENVGFFKYPSRNIIYPNRQVERELLDKAKYNKVFYDPTTVFEMRYRSRNNVKGK